MSTPRDCSGDPMGLGTRRIAQRGLGRETEGSGVKNARVIELHDSNHYVFIVDEGWAFEERASSCSMNEGAYASIIIHGLLDIEFAEKDAEVYAKI